MAHKGFIKLGHKPQKGELSPAEVSKSTVYYPSLYIDNKDLGLGEDDVGKTIMALVQLKVKEVAKRINEKKKIDNASFDILGINLSPGKIPHYKT